MQKSSKFAFFTALKWYWGRIEEGSWYNHSIENDPWFPSNLDPVWSSFVFDPHTGQEIGWKNLFVPHSVQNNTRCICSLQHLRWKTLNKIYIIRLHCKQIWSSLHSLFCIHCQRNGCCIHFFFFVSIILPTLLPCSPCIADKLDVTSIFSPQSTYFF